MTPAEIATTQVRLILQRQCSDMGRELEATLAGECHFILFFADLDECGNLAFYSDGDAEPAATVMILRRWLADGRIAPTIPVSPAEAAEAVDGMQRLAEKLGRVVPAGVGFALLLWDGDTALAYVSSILREGVQKLVREWLEHAAGDPR